MPLRSTIYMPNRPLALVERAQEAIKYVAIRNLRCLAYLPIRVDNRASSSRQLAKAGEICLNCLGWDNG